MFEYYYRIRMYLGFIILVTVPVFCYVGLIDKMNILNEKIDITQSIIRDGCPNIIPINKQYFATDNPTYEPKGAE